MGAHMRNTHQYAHVHTHKHTGTALRLHSTRAHAQCPHLHVRTCVHLVLLGLRLFSSRSWEGERKRRKSERRHRGGGAGTREASPGLLGCRAAFQLQRVPSPERLTAPPPPPRGLGGLSIPPAQLLLAPWLPRARPATGCTFSGFVSPPK